MIPEYVWSLRDLESPIGLNSVGLLLSYLRSFRLTTK